MVAVLTGVTVGIFRFGGATGVEVSFIEGKEVMSTRVVYGEVG